jgi:hypothetical protein
MTATADDRIAGVSASVAVKAAVHTVATSNVTLSGLQTIGGVVLNGTTLYRVLCVAQTDSTQNGIYDATTGSWSRSADFDGNRDAVQGTRVLVAKNGASNAQEYELTTANPVTFGTSLITFSLRYSANATYDQTAAEAAASITPLNLFSITRPEICPKRFGDTGTGVTNDTTALQNWLTVVGRAEQTAWGVLEGGTYKYSSNLVVPANVNIIGSGTQYSILKPTSAVTIGLSTNDDAIIKRFQIDGSNTSGKTGLLIAGITSANYNEIEDVWVNNFAGASSIGVAVKDSVLMRAKRLFASGNGTNLKVSSASPLSYPTTTVFDQCRFANSTIGPGALVESGQMVIFNNATVFEGNTQEGLLILPTGVTASVQMEVQTQSCWFERNYAGNTAKYHHVAGDGTALNGASIRVLSRDCFYNGDGSTCKAIDMNGSAVLFKISDPRFPTAVQPNWINIRNSAFGDISDWNQNFTYSTTVTDSTITTSAASGIKTFTPTRNAFTEVLGGGTITATGRWTKIGRRVFWNIALTAAGGATIASVANTSNFSISNTTGMPPVLTIDTCVVVRSNDGTSFGVGYCAVSGGNNIIGTPPWAAAAGSYIISGSYEIVG